MFLSRITIFPIKSLDGVTLNEAAITAGGILEHDREFAIFDAEGRVINGKRTPRVHQLRCSFDDALREVRLWKTANTRQHNFLSTTPPPSADGSVSFLPSLLFSSAKPKRGSPMTTMPSARPSSAKPAWPPSPSGIPN